MSVCIDTSFIVSRYITDVHSTEADRRMAHGQIAWITPLNRAEVAHAIYSYIFRKTISAAAAQSAWNNFEQDCESGLWFEVELPASVWECSIRLARLFGPTLGMRTLDSLHVACAVELGATRFWTFDERQERLAIAAGLNTNP